MKKLIQLLAFSALAMPASEIDFSVSKNLQSYYRLGRKILESKEILGGPDKIIVQEIVYNGNPIIKWTGYEPYPRIEILSSDLVIEPVAEKSGKIKLFIVRHKNGDVYEAFYYGPKGLVPVEAIEFKEILSLRGVSAKMIEEGEAYSSQNKQQGNF